MNAGGVGGDFSGPPFEGSPAGNVTLGALIFHVNSVRARSHCAEVVGEIWPIFSHRRQVAQVGEPFDEDDCAASWRAN